MVRSLVHKRYRGTELVFVKVRIADSVCQRQRKQDGEVAVENVKGIQPIGVVLPDFDQIKEKTV